MTDDSRSIKELLAARIPSLTRRELLRARVEERYKLWLSDEQAFLFDLASHLVDQTNALLAATSYRDLCPIRGSALSFRGWAECERSARFGTGVVFMLRRSGRPELVPIWEAAEVNARLAR